MTIPRPSHTIVPLRQRPAWKALKEHYAEVRSLHLRQLFTEDSQRGECFALEVMGLYFDYSKNRITSETTRLLLDLAEQSGLRPHIDAMFAGDKINVTEQRAVLHVALRAPKGTQIFLDVDVVPEVHAVLDKMAEFVEQIRSGAWKGHTGKRIRNVVNIGIGGSDLGPVMAYEALKYYSQRDMIFRFVSNVDGTDVVEATRDLKAEETLFIVSSKTFTTLETGRGDISRTLGRENSAGTAEEGYLYCGPSGAGHFVKMVHNGIEYGLMEAYAEGLNILRHANVGKQGRTVDAETTPLRNPEHYQYDFNLADVSEVWRRGSVIASWLLDLTAIALFGQHDLSKFSGRVSDSGEGRWTITAAIDEGAPAPVLSAALYQRCWVGFNFRKAFGCPVKVINDAAMQALGSYKGGRMLFLGLGAGLGSAMIVDGILDPVAGASCLQERKDLRGLRWRSWSEAIGEKELAAPRGRCRGTAQGRFRSRIRRAGWRKCEKHQEVASRHSTGRQPERLCGWLSPMEEQDWS